MSLYQKGTSEHISYGQVSNGAGIVFPVIEGIGFFGGQALGPNVRSAGYPSPATLPQGASGDVPTFGTLGGGGRLTWPLVIGLVVVSAIGIYIVHRQTWR